MDKFTGYLQYFETVQKDEAHKNAQPFSHDKPNLLTFRSGDKLFLGQLRTEQNTSITSVSEILEILDKIEVSGQRVTISAFNMTMAVSKKLRSVDADYVIALKGKHQNLYVDAVEYFQELLSAEAEEFKYDSVQKMEKPEDEETEERFCYTSSDISWLHYRRDWANLKSVAMIMREVKEDGKRIRKAGYYVSNLPAEPEHFIPAAQRYWGERKIIWWMCVEEKPLERENKSDEANTAECAELKP